MKKIGQITVTAMCAAAVVGVLAVPAGARTTMPDGRPNVLVIMTDDMSAQDLRQLPNIKSYLADQGTSFDNAVDSFPLCCPSRATFITGQYAHNHGVFGNFWPYGWYGMGGRDNILPVWLHNTTASGGGGYTTGMVGKWLNGYGAGKGVQSKVIGGKNYTVNVPAGGEVPAGFDYWRGLLDVSAYDYFNFKMKVKDPGKTATSRTWGDADYANALVEFANLQVKPGGTTLLGIVTSAQNNFRYSAAARRHNTNGLYDNWYGTADQANYTVDVTGKVTEDLVADQKTNAKPFFMWWSPASPHREDANGEVRNNLVSGYHEWNPVTGVGVKDPRPPARYDSILKMGSAYKTFETEIMSKPNFDKNTPVDKTQGTIPKSLTDGGKPIKVADQPALSPADKERLAEDYQGRVGALRAMDDHVKSMVERLKATGQYDNTVIVFTSDNGFLQGEHRIPGDKYVPYEESIRVPFIMEGPGIRKNAHVSDLVSNIDFAPTILDAAKANAGRTMDGVSLLPKAKSATATLPDRAIGLEANAPLFSSEGMPHQYDKAYFGVRTSRWKYVKWAYGLTELYDLQADPYELNNLASDPAYSSTVSSMQTKMNALKACAGATCRAVTQ